MRHHLNHLLLIFIFGLTSLHVDAQQFKGHYLNTDLKVKLEINLNADSIAVPGLPDERCYGYLQGNLNGTWVILKVESVKDNKAVVRAACDNGSDSQTIEFTQTDDRTLVMRLVGDANIKTIEGRKYVKLPKNLPFKR